MILPSFKLEEYLSEREFSTPFSLCSSDLETHKVTELLALADSESEALWNKLSLGYTTPKGMLLLREEISALYQNVTADEVLIFSGAEEGIYCAAHALLGPDDHAIVVAPSFQSLSAVPATLCKVTTIWLEENTQWKLDVNLIASALQSNTKLIVMNFPNSPTGAILDSDTFIRLINLARDRGIYIFSDEVYRLLEFDEAERLPAICDCYEKGLSLSVMSKAFGLAGLRIGWIASKDKALLKRMEQIKYYLTICNSAPGEVLSLIALRARQNILLRNRSIVASNLPLLDAFVERCSDRICWVRPKGGCVGFPRLLSEKLFVEEVASQLLQEEQVLILPGHVFHLPGNYFRIGFGRYNMPEALSRFERFIDKHL